MIGSLRGTVLERAPEGEVLVEVAGVGYRVVVSPRTLAALEPGAATFLHIHHHIREDAQTLYGFPSRDERLAFEVLLGAHRVGPALALAILATHGPRELRMIVAERDVAALCLVPGVGKQTAARLLLELAGRLGTADVVGVEPAGAGGSAPPVMAVVSDALAGLGYAPDEVRVALRDLDRTSGDAEALLREALRELGSRRAG
jgi:Holliday junction DNA helicase RuvA